MRTFTLICVICFLSGLGAAQTTHPATQPQTQPATQPAEAARAKINPEEARRRAAETRKAAVAQLSDAGTFELSELVTFSLRRQTLHARFHPPQRLVEATSGGPARLSIRGDHGVWEFGQKSDDNTDATGPYTALTRYDFDATLDPTRVETAAVHVRNDVVTIRGARGGVRPVAVLLSVRRTPQPAMSMTVSGQRVRLQNIASVYQLRRQQSQVVRELLAPALRIFNAEHLLAPGATDYYRAFEQIPADGNVARRVREQLPKLETEPFAAREDASNELDALGPAGVLAILRMDRSQLGAEAQRRLEAHLAKYSHWPDESPAEAVANSDFLLEAMNFDDPAVREAAKGAMEKLTGAAVAVDLSQPREARREALEAFRQKMFPTTLPAQ